MKFNLIGLIILLGSATSTAQNRFDQQPVSDATLRFIKSLTADQKTICTRPWADTNRTQWSNLPLEQVNRDGLRLDQLQDSQRVLIHDVLRTILSEQGYQKALFIMQYDEDTHTRLTAAKVPIAHRYGHEKYWTWIFGSPGVNKEWGFKFEGHHLSINMTFSAKGVSCTPHFTGINPGLITKGMNAGKYLLYHESELGKNLFVSLSEAQRKKAHIDTLPFTIDVRTQNGKEPFLTAQDGLPYPEMNTKQRALVMQILNAWVDNFHPDIAGPKKKLMNTYLNQMRFVWMGTSSVHDLHYYGFLGPGWVIEFATRDQGIQHFHTLWRVMPDDFGIKL
ncbi:MAG: DUF3500 domain-containing protein [Saprospiraceae bacterium]|nr:DUF3500 domain-containing protein [Saprospiraceae bacterium]